MTPDEQAAFNEELGATIAQRLATINWPSVLSADGSPKVAMDAQGHLVEYHSDGSSSRLDADAP